MMSCQTKKSATPNYEIFSRCVRSNIGVLVSDVGVIEWTDGHAGAMPIQETHTQTTFVDDIYLFTYLSASMLSETKNSNGRTKLAGGENPVTKAIVQSAHGCASIFNRTAYSEIRILHTIKIDSDGSIGNIVRAIDVGNENKYTLRFAELNNGESPAAIAILKLDAANIEPSDILAKIDTFQTRLFGIGFGIYSIDITRDHAGTLHHKTLENHFVERGFETSKNRGKIEQMLLHTGETNGRGYVFTDTSGSGRNTFAFFQREQGCFTRNKIYNKVCAQLEAGDVMHPGGHMYEFATARNTRLARLFADPTMIESGVSRIEVTVYLTGGAIRLQQLVDTQITRVRDILGDAPIFYKQSIPNQVRLFCGATNKSCIFSRHETGDILLVNSANSHTKRICNAVLAKIAPNMSMKSAVMTMASDFGASGAPIYTVDVVATKEPGTTTTTIVQTPKYILVKRPDDPTFLCPTKKPFARCKTITSEDLLQVIPDTPHLKYQLRTKKPKKLGSSRPEGLERLAGDFVCTLRTTRELNEIQEISIAETGRGDYVKCARAMRQQQLADSVVAFERVATEIEKTIAEFVATTPVRDTTRKATIDAITQANGRPQKLTAAKPGDYALVAYRVSNRQVEQTEGGLPTRSVQCCLARETNGTELAEFETFWANTNVQKAIDSRKSSAHTLANKHDIRDTLALDGWEYLPDAPIVRLSEMRSFVAGDGKKIEYVPTQCIRISAGAMLMPAEYEALAEAMDAHNKHLDELRAQQPAQMVHIPLSPDIRKQLKKCTEIAEGEYTAARYTVRIFRNNVQYFLECGEHWVGGFFIDQQIVALKTAHGELHNHIAPIPYRLGAKRTTPNKKQARVCDIVV